MKKYLELSVRTYLGKEYRDYIKGMDESEEEEWKKHAVVVPTSTASRMLLFDPSLMEVAIEVSSIEAAEAHPEAPKCDSVDLYIKGGMVVTLAENMKNFEKKLKKFYTQEV